MRPVKRKRSLPRFDGYPGYFEKGHPIHAALANLSPGDPLDLRCDNPGVGLFDLQGACVARLSQKAETFWLNRLQAVRDVRVLALVRRSTDQDDDPSRRERCRVNEWEIPVVEVVYQTIGD